MKKVRRLSEIEPVRVEGHQGFTSRLLFTAAHSQLTIRLLEIEPGGRGPVPAHRHAAGHFFLVMEGALEIDLDGQRGHVPAGSFLEVEPDITHQLHCPGEIPAVVLAVKRGPGSGQSD